MRNLLAFLRRLLGVETKRDRESQISNWAWWVYCGRQQGLPASTL